jgi:tRNA G18 (ribose-2'-O)-methylase SpoU
MEILGFKKCVINDRYMLLNKPWTKDLMRKMRSYSAGAIQYIDYEFTTEPEVFLKEYPGRKIVAAAPGSGVFSIDDFEFRNNDIVIFGAEADGLTPGFDKYCDVQVTIPAVGVTNSMNVSVAAGIVLYLARKSLDN